MSENSELETRLSQLSPEDARIFQFHRTELEHHSLDKLPGEIGSTMHLKFVEEHSSKNLGRPLFLVRIILATTCCISPIPWGLSACELICFWEVWAFFVNCVRCRCKNPVRKDDAFY
jgi:hypothetical protein